MRPGMAMYFSASNMESWSQKRPYTPNIAARKITHG